MGDLVSGRYPDYFNEYLLDGQPNPPYRTSISRGDVTGQALTGAATQTPYVVAVCAEPGDVFNYVSFGIGTLAGTAGSTSFVVVYSAVPTSSAAATVLAVSATTTFTLGANKILLSTPVVVSGTDYTPQGSAPASVSNGPQVLGVAIVETWTTSGSQFDGMSGGKAAFKGLIGSQIPLAGVSSGTVTSPPAVGASSGTTWSAPSTGFLPYVILSRQ
jgi:hypothetical protein